MRHFFRIIFVCSNECEFDIRLFTGEGNNAVGWQFRDLEVHSKLSCHRYPQEMRLISGFLYYCGRGALAKTPRVSGGRDTYSGFE